jgi:hypothetical protein
MSVGAPINAEDQNGITVLTGELSLIFVAVIVNCDPEVAPCAVDTNGVPINTMS